MATLPWLEIELYRFVVANPSWKFKGLADKFGSEYPREDIADAVCFLVHKGLISLTPYGFKAKTL
jgi:hypothetical protein